MLTLPDDASVWVLAGQSNMAGSGGGAPYETPSERVLLFNLRDEWQRAEEPFTLDRYLAKDEAFALMRYDFKCYDDPGYRTRRASEYARGCVDNIAGAGPGLTFGKAISDFTGRPVGLIFCAKGDTRMSEWAPDYAGHPYMALYQATMRRIRAINRPVVGIVWYQGESDTFDDKGKNYAAEMRKLVAAFRRDTGQPDLPFLYVQIGACVQQTVEELPDWNLVQETQRLLEPELTPCSMAPAIDLPLCDGIHLATLGQQRLGRRLGKLARRVIYGDRSIEIGPRPVAVTRDPRDHAMLTVSYAGVNGRLGPDDRVAGFSLFAPDAQRDLVCCAQVIAPTTVRVRSYCAIPDGSQLWYGHGLMPFCNLVDGEDMAAPVFGPWPVPPQTME